MINTKLSNRSTFCLLIFGAKNGHYKEKNRCFNLFFIKLINLGLKWKFKGENGHSKANRDVLIKFVSN
jgi:hypothetical protein